jgi:hypothetical protein
MTELSLSHRQEIVALLAQVILRSHRPKRRIKPPQNVADFPQNCLDEPPETLLSVHSGLHPENLGEPQ